ncbi:S8 family serine peptidase [Halococcus agarilyticus]|uniref:S8 family serine peptidase n=1 Tax=Halococcus agarilyticus TaxID=1232219 RepID=UPI0009ACA113|nr:S8 family serine peptidase [Halococcus agarilyticus]
MPRKYATVLAIIVAGVVTLSMAAPFAGAMGTGHHSTQHSIDSDTTQLSSVGGQTQATQSAGATQSQAAPIGSALQDANGTVDVLLVLDQAAVDRGADREETIETLKQHAASTQSSVTTDATDLGGVDVTNRFWIANLVAATVDTNETSVRSLAQINGVNAVVKSREISVPEPPENQPVRPTGDDAAAGPNDINTTYGLDQINATQTWNEFDTRGEGTKVAVLDTGVDIGHPDIDLYTENASNETYPGGWAEFDENGNQVPGSEPRDSAYHGTHVSGTVSGGDASGQYIGVAPNVQLMHGMVIPGGSGSTTQVIGGVQWAVSEGADVASLSLGAGCGLFGPVYSQAWIPVVENAKSSGTSFVAAAGNAGEGCVGSPGNDHKTFSIGASNAQGDIAEFSSGGVIDKSNWDDPPAEWPSTFIKPNVSAPGAAVTSADPDGNGYQNLSGTSMATPHVAGAIALMHSANPDASVYEIQQALNKTAWRPADPTPPSDERSTQHGQKDTRYGMGIIDVHNATQQIAAAAPESELGDVNENGEVNVQDVRLMQQYLYGQEPENFNANLGDMNRDGEVTRTDLRLLQRKVQGTLDEGEIQVSNLTAPDEVNETETFNVTVDLENPGDEGALQEIAFHVAENESDLGEGEPVATEIVDMAPEGVDDPVDRPHETTVAFEIDASNLPAGDYYHGVFSEDDSATGEITVLGSNFEVSDLSAPAEVEQGDAFDVNATIANTGNQADTQTVEYRLDGTVERTTNVTLGAGESTTVGFEDIETDGVSAGTYQHGVHTEDDSQTANITVLEGFFDVEITDAPDEASPGETVNVSATVENTGNATDEQTVRYDLVPNQTDVAVVDDVNDTQSQALVDRLESSLPAERYDVTFVNASNVMDEIDAYDTFVVNEFQTGDGPVEDFHEATDDTETGVVYLDQWGNFGGSDAVNELSSATGNPASHSDEFSAGDPYFQITQDHPIFAGVGDPGDQVDVFTGSGPEHSWHSDYSGQTIATVGESGTTAGAAIAVDASTNTVLADSLGQTSYLPAPFSEASNRILANSVAHVSGFGPVGTSVGALDDTSENVTLDPGESETVEFTDTVPDDIDISIGYRHVVESEDDTDYAPLTIDVERGAVEGTVTNNATGDPIEGATVDVTVEVDDGNYTAVTGADGTYRIDGVPAGTHNVTVSAEGYENTTAEVDVPANGTVTQDFALAPMDGSISGTVTASDTGEPVANVTVAAEDGEGNVHEAMTGANGTYTIDVPPGQYVVNVADTPGDYRPQEIVTVAPGEAVTGVDFEVTPRNGSIAGSVESAAGQPIEGAHVVDADGDAFNVTTDESGHYEITGLDRGTYALRAKAEGYNATDIEFVEVPANGTTTQNFTLGSFFAVSDLSAPATAAQGDTIDVSATLTNTGSEQATRTAFYFPPGTDFGGDTFTTQSHLSERVTLDGGESTTVTFTYDVATSREPGEYEHGVSADEVASSTITIEEAETPGEANYSVSDLSAPATAAPGEEIDVNATITNTGNATGTQTVEYLFDGTTANTSEVTLDPGESTTVAFSPMVPATEGTYQHGVETADDSALANISVEAGEPEPAYFAISNLTGPSEVGQGESFTTTATITNTGDEEGTQTIYPFLGEASTLSQYDLGEFGSREMLANFRPQAAPQQVTLDGGESTTVTFTYDIAADKEPGDYAYTISSLQEIASHPLTVTAANGSGQAAVPPAPVFANGGPPAPVFENGAPPAPVFGGERADGIEQQRQSG